MIDLLSEGELKRRFDASRGWKGEAEDASEGERKDEVTGRFEIDSETMTVGKR